VFKFSKIHEVVLETATENHILKMRLFGI